jgi:hypothetical protein
MTEVQRIRHKDATVLDQVETRNRVWNPITLAWEVETNAAQAVTGPLTDTELRAADVKVTLDGEMVRPILPSTATVSQVASSASSVTLKASNASRMGLIIFNDSTAALYVKFGETASTTDFTVKILAGGYFELPFPCYTGKVDGIWAAANGYAYVTEMTA